MGFIADQVKQQLTTRDISILEFAESCHKPLYPRQRVILKLIFLEEMEGWEEDILSEWMDESRGDGQIDPMIRKKRDWLRANEYMHFPETILIGGRRSGKGYISGISLAKKMYDVWKLGDPGSYFKIDADKSIYFSCIASALDQAKKHQFADFMSTVSRCDYLKNGKIQEESFTIPTAADQQYILEMRNKGLKVGRDWSKLRGNPLAANADTLRGSATIAAIFDEMAFMMEGTSRSSADQCYTALKPSLSQFGKWQMIFCNSSPATMVGKFYELYKFSRETIIIEDEEVPRSSLNFTLQFPSWELYKDYERVGYYTFDNKPDKFFKEPLERALMVSPDVDITKLSPADADLCRESREEERKNPDSFKVEYRGQWATITDAYLDPIAVTDAFAPAYQGQPIRMNTKGGTYMLSYKAHADPSKTTAGFGFAIGHVETFKKIKFDEDNEPYVSDEDEPHVVFDVVQRWSPEEFPGKNIDWRQVINEMMTWCEIFPSMKELTFDQFNSAAPMQEMQRMISERRLNTVIYEKTASHQLNWRRWEEFKSAINQRRVHIPDDCPDSRYAQKELAFLQVRNGRVDHPTLGEIQTKDISDCIAEVVYYFMNTEHGWLSQPNKFPTSFGASGGYAIGDNSYDPHQRIADLRRAGSNRNASPFSQRGISHRSRRTR